MSNVGNPESPNTLDPVENSVTDDSIDTNAADAKDGLPRLMLIVIGVILVGAVALGIYLFSILYAVIFLPDVPLPESELTELRHENFTYGADRWVYGVSMDGCELVTFYIQNDAECVVAPGLCGLDGFVASSPNAQQLATCTGNEAFSIFGMQWEVSISAGYVVEPITRFEVRREVQWFGVDEDSALEAIP